MIPRHRPPFSVGDVLTTVLAPSRKLSVEEVEDLCAKACGVPNAVLLPSARAGICWALRAAIDEDTRVIGPAYTCEAVHEAIARSRGRLRLVDTDTNTFLMDPVRLATERSRNHAVVLSEIYGYSYSSYAMIGKDSTAPRIRIIDTAMTVPMPKVFEKLHGNDFAVTSFGLGKCFYSGWGGIGLTRDDALARDIRAQRDAALHKEKSLLLLKRGTEILLRTLAHTPVLYGTLQKFRPPPRNFPTFPSAWTGDGSLSKEWYLPSTQIDRRLLCHNLERRFQLNDRRLSLASRYHENLAGVTGIILPATSSLALSHYAIRVDRSFRDSIRRSLMRLGVDTGVLFRAPGYLSQEKFPNTCRISSEVVNLPLDACLTDDEVNYISDCVINCVSKVCYGRPKDKPVSLSQPNPH